MTNHPITDAPAFLRNLRKAAKLTTVDLACLMYVSQPLVTRIERPHHNATVKSIKAYALACGYKVHLVATKIS